MKTDNSRLNNCENEVTAKAINQLCYGNDKSHPEDDTYNGGGSYDGW